MRVDAMDAPRLQRVLSTNVVGSFMCAREAVRRLSTKHGGAGGAIVNISSGGARLGSPGEYVDYAASKGVIDTLTIGLALEVAEEGIRADEAGRRTGQSGASRPLVGVRERVLYYWCLHRCDRRKVGVRHRIIPYKVRATGMRSS
jgi:hypothetical protein